MSAKKFVRNFIIFFLCICILLTGIVFIADPLFQYHKPWLTETPYLYNSVYQAPGLARNTTYDSVLLGTSMTENFQTDWFDRELGWNTVKLTYSGARTSDIHAVLGEIFNSGNTVKNIFMNLDIYQLEVDYTTCYTERPEYLYGTAVYDDFQYIFNKDVIGQSLHQIFNAVRHYNQAGNMSNAYSWSAQDGIDVSAEAVLKDCEKERESFSENLLNANEEDYLENAKRNLENITYYIKEHPDTTFNFFFPPYSIMFWETCMLHGNYDLIFSALEQTMEELFRYPNVKVFYFQNCEKIITDLSLYRDSIHYNADVNRDIFDCFTDNKNQIYPETYKKELDKTRSLVSSFDYQKIWDNYYQGLPIQ